MKTLVLILSFAVAVACTALTIFIVKFQPDPKADKTKKARSMISLSGVTLTGVKADDANKMVLAFFNQTNSSHIRTDIWFSRRWLETVIKELNAEASHYGWKIGIRIYFAKDPITNNNTVVVVSTNDDSQGNHIDNLKHTFNFQFSPTDIVEERLGSAGLPAGALLYSNNKPGISDPCSIVSINPNAISPDDAYNYVNEFSKVNNQGINTMSEWFSLTMLEFLKDDLDEAENHHNVPDGIRLYFAKNTSAKHLYRHCFVLVPTIIGKDSQNNPIPHMDDFNCYDGKALNKFMNKLVGDPEENGEECPNNCDGVTLPAN